MTVATGHNAHTSITFMRPDSKYNRRYVIPGKEVNTGKYEQQNVYVKDARPKKTEFSLEKQGFVLNEHTSTVTDFTDDTQINKIYFPEIEKFVKKITGADKVVVYGCVVRVAKQSSDGKLNQPPAADAHVDFTTKEATSLAQNLLVGAGDPEYQYSRALHVSNWRTFSPGPQDWPLAVCDARSVKDDEGKTNSIIELDVWPADVNPPYEVLPDLDPAIVTRESTAFPYQKGHEWWYFSDMHRGEVLTFKLHDSDHSGVWRTPHTAFPNDAENAKPRCSVEIRSCAYFK